MMAAMRTFIPAVVAVLSAAAQTAPDARPLAAITGLVRDAITNNPLANVRIQFGRWTSRTDSEGRFSVQKVDPGRYWISALDDNHAGSGGIYTLLAAGPDPASVEITVKLGGTISGRVLDENRRPVEGAAVLVVEPVFNMGEAGWMVAGSVLSDRDGNYRVGPVRCGHRYHIVAKKQLRARDAAAPAARDSVAVPTWYPDAIHLEESQPVVLTPSEDHRGTDIRLATAPWYCIEGAAAAPGGVTLPALEIAEHFPFTGGWKYAPITAATGADGRFLACGLHSGEYRLTAAAGATARDRTVASAKIEISDRDLADVRVPVYPPVLVEGDTVWDPAPSRPVEAGLGVSLTTPPTRINYVDGGHPDSGFAFGMDNAAKIGVPGTFTLGSWPVDDYRVSISGIPRGCYVKDVTWGGASVLHAPLRLALTPASRLQVTLACDAGTLTAHVADRDGAPVSNVNLYIIPAPLPPAAQLPDILRRASVQQGWSGPVAQLPPGRYLAIACDLELDGTADTMMRLWRAISKGKEVDVGGHAMAQVALEPTTVE
jgi:hypothetical protein